MRLLACSAALLAAVAGAQDLQPTADRLTHLRAALNAWPEDYCGFVIASVNGHEPVVLCHGTDANARPAHQLTYTPLGALVRLLVADALHVKLGGQLDVSAGVVVGGRQPTILELLQGTDLLPDYWDLRDSTSRVTCESLLACADFAAAEGISFNRTPAGMAGLMLLEPRILDNAVKDWPSFLRTTLAPRASGLDLHDAADLLGNDRHGLSVSTPIAAQAHPPILRLFVTPKELASWWQWRMRSALPLWEGYRMGRLGHLPSNEQVSFWHFEDFGTRPIKTLARIYPRHRPGIVCILIGPAKWVPGQADALTGALEDDLFGEQEQPEQVGAGGRIRVGASARTPPLADWRGKRWVGPQDAAQRSEVQIVNETDQGLTLTFGNVRYTSVQVLPYGESLRVVVDIDRLRGGLLWLRPQPNRRNPEQLLTLFVERGEHFTLPHLMMMTLAEQPR